jgi:hypothetical protein
MSRQYKMGMFILCFCIWAVVVDNVVIPSDDLLRQDNGAFTRYRVKKWQKGGKFDIIKDELMIYVISQNREKLYYMEYKPHFEATLKNMPEGSSVQVRYSMGFPKVWKKHVYSLNNGGIPIMRYSSTVLLQKQRDIWKFTGIMGGIYLGLLVLGWISKPRKK